MNSLIAHFQTVVHEFPNRVAIINGDSTEVTFLDLQKRINFLSNYWQSLGVKKGCNVLIATPIHSDLYASLAAIWSLGATVILPEPAMGLAGLRNATNSVNITHFCASGHYKFLKLLLRSLWKVKMLPVKRGLLSDPPNELASIDDIALISFTSGTSGKPKAIPRSHGFLLAQMHAIDPLLSSSNNERDLVAFPVFTLINLARGRTSILPNWKMSKLDKLSPSKLAEWIQKTKVTRALLPPSLCQKLTNLDGADQLNTVFCGGGPIFPDLIKQLQTSRPDLNIICVYGSTEAEPIAHLSAQDIYEGDFKRMLKGEGVLVGAPVTDIDVRIIDNEIQVSGKHVNEGYLNPRHTAENKINEYGKIWHRTGDAGCFDAKKRLWLWGRIDSEITVEGMPIYPFQLETAIRQWDGIKNCAFISVNNTPIIVIEGDIKYKQTWQENGTDLGIKTVVSMQHIPMDKRHHSKVDVNALIDCLKMP